MTEIEVTQAEITKLVRPVIGAVLLMKPDDPKLADPRIGVAAEVAKVVARYHQQETAKLREALVHIASGQCVHPENEARQALKDTQP